MNEISERDEIGKAICRVLADIAQREKTKAIQSDNYGDALVAAIFEEFFKEATLSF